MIRKQLTIVQLENIRNKYPNMDIAKFEKWYYKFLDNQLKRIKHKELLEVN